MHAGGYDSISIDYIKVLELKTYNKYTYEND